MVVAGSPIGGNIIGVPQFRTNPLKQAAGKSASKYVAHHFESRIILVLQDSAQMAQGKERLCHVFFNCQIDSGRRLGGHRREGRHGRLLHGPIGEQLLQLGFHLRRGEISVDREHDVGGKEIALVERDQVLTLDAVDGLVFLAPPVGIVAAVNDVGKLALGDSMRIVIAPGDAAAKLGFRQIDLFLPEFRAGENVFEHGEDFIGILLQCGKGNSAARLADAALHHSGHVFQLLIELVAGAVFSSASAHDHSCGCRQADLVFRIEEISGPDQGESADNRELAIFEQIELHAVRQREAFDVGDFDLAERGELQVFVGCGGRRLGWTGCLCE